MLVTWSAVSMHYTTELTDALRYLSWAAVGSQNKRANNYNDMSVAPTEDGKPVQHGARQDTAGGAEELFPGGRSSLIFWFVGNAHAGILALPGPFLGLIRHHSCLRTPPCFSNFFAKSLPCPAAGRRLNFLQCNMPQPLAPRLGEHYSPQVAPAAATLYTRSGRSRPFTPPPGPARQLSAW